MSVNRDIEVGIGSLSTSVVFSLEVKSQ